MWVLELGPLIRSTESSSNFITISFNSSTKAQAKLIKASKQFSCRLMRPQKESGNYSILVAEWVALRDAQEQCFSRI